MGAEPCDGVVGVDGAPCGGDVFDGGGADGGIREVSGPCGGGVDVAGGPDGGEGGGGFFAAGAAGELVDPMGGVGGIGGTPDVGEDGGEFRWGVRVGGGGLGGVLGGPLAGGDDATGVAVDGVREGFDPACGVGRGFCGP